MAEFGHLNKETGEIWNANADYWDGRMGEGNDFHKLLIEPNQLRLLGLRSGELVLEIACGNGQFTRKMAEQGVSIVATDVAGRMIENARRRTTENADRIEYSVLDATDREQLLSLGERKFDAAVCTMAIMDIASIEPLVSSLARLLKAGGRFVFSITHPCFNSTNGLTRGTERVERDGEVEDRQYVKVYGYIHSHAFKGLAMIGQPVAQNYFHRPVSALFNTFFKEGFVLDGIEEPVFDERANPVKALNWDSFRDIPPVFMARMRLMER